MLDWKDNSNERTYYNNCYKVWWVQRLQSGSIDGALHVAMARSLTDYYDALWY